jgi:hypothetical protein
MDKEDWIWVTIKIFGIYLIILAIINLPEVISNWWTVSPFSKIDSKYYLSSGEECQLMAERLRSIGISNFIASIAKVDFFSAMGIYLVKSGKILFNLIMPGKD